MDYQSILNELGPKKFEQQDIWLFSAVSSTNVTITDGTYYGYTGYCGLSYYYEEIATLSSQTEGVKGVCSTDVIFTLKKNESTLALYQAFAENQILKSIHILQLITVPGDFHVQQDITFTTCKIGSFKISMREVTFSMNYSGRSEKFNVFNGDGSKKGCVGLDMRD